MEFLPDQHRKNYSENDIPSKIDEQILRGNKAENGKQEGMNHAPDDNAKKEENPPLFPGPDADDGNDIKRSRNNAEHGEDKIECTCCGIVVPIEQKGRYTNEATDCREAQPEGKTDVALATRSTSRFPA
jgi:hypothetical protein